jgi:hypothetical protein
MSQCPRCQLELGDTPRACPRCGLLLDPNEVAEMIRRFRERVATHLELIGDFRAQLEYPVVEEWVCQWFDDLGFSEMGVRSDSIYAKAFSESEWSLLARFTELFDRTEPFDPIEDLQATAEWRRLAQAAVETANALFGASGGS